MKRKIANLPRGHGQIFVVLRSVLAQTWQMNFDFGQHRVCIPCREQYSGELARSILQYCSVTWYCCILSFLLRQTIPSEIPRGHSLIFTKLPSECGGSHRHLVYFRQRAVLTEVTEVYITFWPAENQPVSVTWYCCILSFVFWTISSVLPRGHGQFFFKYASDCWQDNRFLRVHKLPSEEGVTAYGFIALLWLLLFCLHPLWVIQLVLEAK